MYIPVKLEIENILSYRNTEYKFEKGKAVIVTGENRDDDGQESNGSGKSGFVQAIAFAVLSDSLRNIKDQDLVHYGEESGSVSLTLTNPIKGSELKIVRTVFTNKNKSSKLDIFINGKEEKSLFPTVNEGNKWILNELGITRDDFIDYFLVSKTKSKSFYSQSDTQKKAIVSRFSGTYILEPVKLEIKEDIKAKESELQKLREEKLKWEGGKEVFIESMKDETLESEVERRKKIIEKSNEDIKVQKLVIEDIKKDITEIENNIEKENVKLLKAKADVSNFQKTDFVTEITKLEKEGEIHSKKVLSTVTEIDSINDVISEFKSFKSEIEQNLRDSISCPSCGHKFILRDEEYNLEEAKEQLPAIEGELLSLNTQKQVLEESMKVSRENEQHILTKIQKLRKDSIEESDRFSKLNKVVSDIERSIVHLKTEIEHLQTKISGKEELIVTIQLSIDSLSEKEIEDPKVKYEEKLKVYDEKIKECSEKFQELDSELSELQILHSKMISFSTHLSNKAVKSIEIRTNEYLSNMDSNLSIEIEGYRVTSEGDIREKFTTVVLRDGIREAFIENFSEGERARINIATTLALNSLLNMSSSDGQGLELVVLDELMGSLDRLGVGLTMKALSKLDQTILSISHVEPKYPYEHTLKVIKENGESRLEKQN